MLRPSVVALGGWIFYCINNNKKVLKSYISIKIILVNILKLHKFT
jgi:hypothetical protein